MSLMFSPWRLPHLDRIGKALADYERCRCRKCKAAVLRTIETYEERR